MEKGLFLKSEIRDQVGTKSSAQIRKEGRIPAVVYGHKKGSVSIT